MKCQIKVVKEVVDIFVKYQPKVGQIYDAEFSPSNARCGRDNYGGKREFCIIDIFDKKIILRPGEYEIVRYSNG